MGLGFWSKQPGAWWNPTIDCAVDVPSEAVHDVGRGCHYFSIAVFDV